MHHFMFFVMDLRGIEMERCEEKHATLTRMGMPSGTSSTTTRPCTPNGQAKEEIEVLEAHWHLQCHLAYGQRTGQYVNGHASFSPPSRGPSPSSDANTDLSAHTEAAALGAYTIGM